MKQNLLLGYCITLIVLFCSACSDEQDNTATSADGVKIVFDKRGDGEPAIIFVHGWANNKSIWDEQMKYFSQKYESIAVDLPGFGESGDDRSNWTIESFGNDIISVINDLNLSNVVLVGFSMGGPVVLEAANKIPESVVGVVLVDAIHNAEMKVSPQMINYIDSVFMDLIQNPTNEKLVSGGFYKKNHEQSYQRVLAMIKDTSRTGWRESLHSNFNWYNENCTEALNQLQVPLVAINSDRMPTNEESFKKYIPEFHLKIIPNTGHVVMWDAPDEFNNLLESSIQEFESKSK